ncbi:DNA-binding response regulator [Paraburkholderia tropica]|uniref:response regulator transcription factor n=1 Tax=Paraburkholderia TaxID=1822464 RepID=UPI001CAFC343|nr:MULTISPECIES: response regulator transcription factor [Paraburkholderia]CAG9206465.1 DNA-binding response regulator [Paraburkholderia tropica]
MPETPELTRPARIIVADDHPLVLFALENLLASLSNLRVVARAQSVPQLFEEALLHDFDLAMLDLYMPGECGEDGHGAVQRFQRTFPDKAVVVLTMEDEAEALRNAINLNVEAVLSKRDRIDLIPVAIASAMAREHYIGPVVRDLLKKAEREQRREEVLRLLSRREFEVLTHYASGLGVTEIAGLLGRSVKTISAQKCAAMKKLALTSDIDLYRFALECGVVQGEGR